VLADADQHHIRAVTVESDYSLDSAHDITARLLRRRGAPTGIIYSNDLMAVGGLTALREAGRDGVSVVSWDDSLLCRTAWPGITALQRDPYQAGLRTATKLLEMVRKPGDAQVAQVARKPSHLVVRESSHPYQA
jgi:DNA-binding LacI/PurR family transcriptional regulator